jgi:hypothetical protein
MPFMTVSFRRGMGLNYINVHNVVGSKTQRAISHLAAVSSGREHYIYNIYIYIYIYCHVYRVCVW